MDIPLTDFTSIEYEYCISLKNPTFANIYYQYNSATIESPNAQLSIELVTITHMTGAIRDELSGEMDKMLTNTNFITTPFICLRKWKICQNHW